MPLFWIKSICCWKIEAEIVVEPDDKTALYLETRTLELLDALHQIASFVLGLAAFSQTVFIGRLDADKYSIEPGLVHKSHQFWVISKINGSFRAKRHTNFPFTPFDQGGQHLGLDMLLVADKVVVYEEDVLAPAQCIETVQFGNDLRGSFGTRTMT